MNRTELYREKRIHKLGIVMAVFFALSVLIAGIIAVDYATVYLTTGMKKVNALSITTGQSDIDIKFMNIDLYHSRK